MFTSAQAIAAGKTRDELRSRRYSRVFRGVYTTGDALDPMIRVRAALLLAGPGALLGGVTALRMMGVWLPSAMEQDKSIHVVIPPGREGPVIPGICVSRGDTVMQPVELGDVYGIHPAQAWLQVASQLGGTDLVVVTDALMRRQATLATRSELQNLVAQFPGHRGVNRARQALTKARAGVDSPMETRLRLALVDAGFPCPEVNYAVRPVLLGKTYRLDMAYPESRLGIEYDGAVHVANRSQMQSDRTRRRQLEDAGWRVITATMADFANLAPLLASVKAALDGRTSTPR